MAGRVRYLLLRDGRYYARLVVPQDLRPYFDRKTELRKPLGADYRQVVLYLSTAVSDLQHRIAVAEERAAQAKGAPVANTACYPMKPEELAQAH